MTDVALCIKQSAIWQQTIKKLHKKRTSGIASPKIWGEPKNLVVAKMFDFTRITLFCLEKRLSKHKMTIFSKNLGGGMAPLPPPGYAYEKNQTLLSSSTSVSFALVFGLLISDFFRVFLTSIFLFMHVIRQSRWNTSQWGCSNNWDQSFETIHLRPLQVRTLSFETTTFETTFTWDFFT